MSQATEARSAFERLLEWTIRVEYPAAVTFLPEAGRAAFLDYYRSLPKLHDPQAFARYRRGMWRTEAGWVARWVARRHETTGRRPRVLDAGSGFGTYAMLFAAAGAEVVGADLRPDRLEAAESRLVFCRRSLGLDLPVRHLRVDLTAAWDADYDLVWVYNALSHIDPLERFLDELRSHLKPGGVMVVGDINGAHTGHLRRLAGLREEVHQEYVAPDGQRSAYAVERAFPPGELRRELQSHGLRVVHHELFWGGSGVLAGPLYEGLLRPLQMQWWLGTRLARRQLMVAAVARSGA
jgi:2-polyprenyl-3-methyl-5-hydroxy-6-metoxy-1,4-benzoquinol methylase